MHLPDDTDNLDTRPVMPHHFFTGVIARQDATIAAAGRQGTAIPVEIRERMRYVESVLLHGNAAGRTNPTINLPTPYTLSDIEAVIGKRDDMTPGSDSSWRSIRRHFDATNGSCGRTK